MSDIDNFSERSYIISEKSKNMFLYDISDDKKDAILDKFNQEIAELQDKKKKWESRFIFTGVGAFVIVVAVIIFSK